MHFVPVLAPVVPFLLGWLDWGASVLSHLAFADAPVCCNNEQEFISINIADIKIVSIKEKI